MVSGTQVGEAGGLGRPEHLREGRLTVRGAAGMDVMISKIHTETSGGKFCGSVRFALYPIAFVDILQVIFLEIPSYYFRKRNGVPASAKPDGKSRRRTGLRRL